VDRSALIAFSSCPVDRNPLAARGSFSIARSVRFWLDSRIKVQTIRISVPFCENVGIQFASQSVSSTKVATKIPTPRTMSEIVCEQIDIVLHMRDGDRRRICHADGIEHAGGCRWTLLTLSLSMAFIFLYCRIAHVQGFAHQRQTFVRCCHGGNCPGRGSRMSNESVFGEQI
jgi:hypothetical protein